MGGDAHTVPVVSIELNTRETRSKRPHTARAGHSQPISRRRPSQSSTGRHRKAAGDGSVTRENSSLSPIDDGKEWNAYARGAHKRASPDLSIAPEPLPARAAQPVAAVASRLAAAGPNYTLPPLFRDTSTQDAVEEELAERFNAKALVDEAVIEEAWQAVTHQTGDETNRSNSGCATDRSIRRGLGKLCELPRPILDAALRNQLPVADTREARHRAGYARGSRRPPVDRKTVPQLDRDRFGWLARYLGHYKQLWLICECLEEHEDVPLTLGEFERAVRTPRFFDVYRQAEDCPKHQYLIHVLLFLHVCAQCKNLGVPVSRRQAVQATKYADIGGVLGFCGWHAARRCDEDAAAAAAAEVEGSDDEHTGSSVHESGTVRQLFAHDRLASPPPSPNEQQEQKEKQAADLPPHSAVANEPKPGPVWRTQSWEVAQQQNQGPVDLFRAASTGSTIAKSGSSRMEESTSPIVSSVERQVEVEELRQRVQKMQAEIERVEDQRSVESLESKLLIDGLRATIREQKKTAASAQAPASAEQAAGWLGDDTQRNQDLKFEQLSMELDRWKDNFAAADAEREGLEKQISALEEQIVEEETASAAYRDETAALREEVQTATARADSAEKQAAAACAKAEAASAQIEAAEAAVETAKTAAARAEMAASRTLSEERLASHSDTIGLADLRVEHAAALAAAQEKNDKRLAAVEATSRVVEDGLRKELEEASARLVASEQRAAELDSKLSKAEASADEFDDIATALDEQLQERTAEVVAVTTERDQLQLAVNDLRKEIRTLRMSESAEEQDNTTSKSQHRSEADTEWLLQLEANHRDELQRLRKEAEEERQTLLDEKERAESASLDEAQKKSEKVIEGLKATISAQGEELEQLKQQLQASAEDITGAVDGEGQEFESDSSQVSTYRPVNSQHGRTNPQRSGSYEYADDDEADGFTQEPTQPRPHSQFSRSIVSSDLQDTASVGGTQERTVGLAVVRTQFVAEEVGDLGLEVGETICLLKAPQSKQWWKGYAKKDDTRRGIFPRSCVAELSEERSYSNRAVFAAAPPSSGSAVASGAVDWIESASLSDDGSSSPQRAVDPPTLRPTTTGTYAAPSAASDWNAANDGGSDWLSDLSSRLGSLEGSFGEVDT